MIFCARAKKGTDVTRQFAPMLTPAKGNERMTFNMDEVFIVHGHDNESKLELARILDIDFGLKSIILHEQPNAGKTLIEKLERHSNSPGYAFVILTPDDVGSEKRKAESLKPRARQNVILELGYFIGKIGRERVCGLLKSDVEIPSDMAGVIYLSFKNSIRECYSDIARELKHAGYNIQI